jgi:hypothetical protein
VKPEELRGEARQVLETWRFMAPTGVDAEKFAMDQVRAAGLVAVDPFERSVAIFRKLGLSEAAAKVAAVGRDGTGREARRPGADRGSVLDALAECFQRPPFGFSAAEATGWAKKRIRDVANQYPGRPDLAEQRLWQIVGASRLAALMPATTGASTTPARKTPARSSRPPTLSQMTDEEFRHFVKTHDDAALAKARAARAPRAIDEFRRPGR